MAKRTRKVEVIGDTIIAAPTNYQGFVYNRLTGECKPNNPRMIAKWEAVEHIFPYLVRGLTFLDIGSLHGFFCLKALEHGATRATGVEMNENFFRPMMDALAKIPILGMAWVKATWPDGHLHADVTMAMSLIHHLVFKDGMSLWDIILGLYACTDLVCIAEMVGRKEPGVIRYMEKQDKPDYSTENFEHIARSVFVKVEQIGVGHCPDRPVYLLWKG